jgi:hypothetical protein
MANWCDISIRVPLEDIPDKGQKQQLEALYKAEEQWSMVAEKDPELRRYDRHKEFINTQPGVQAGMSAHFYKQHGTIWVQPYFKLVVPPAVTSINAEREFRYAFPWWAEVCFAGAKKYCNDKNEALKPDTLVFLYWEHPVQDVIKNLDYIIQVRQNLPVSGPLNQWLWASNGLATVKEAREWFSRFYGFSKRAIAVLDWSEVACNMMDFKMVWQNDNPNWYMAGVKKMEEDTQKLNTGKLSQKEFVDKYARVA